MSTAIIVIALILICIFSAKGYIKRLQHGCCGGGSGEVPQKKVKVTDKNKANYPYTAVLEIDGMTCSRCAQCIENSFNSIDGTWAKVNLEEKNALIRMKTHLDEDTIRQIVRNAGYIPMRISYL